jgi:phosphoenolpyruvate carboxykinase (ATP)
MPWPVARYVDLFREKLRRHRPVVVLMNTGSLGGPYGEGGKRPPLEVTRVLLRAAQSGALRDAPTWEHAEYGVRVPEACPGVSPEMLDPRKAWTGTPEAYTRAARELAAAFAEHVTRPYAGAIDPAILNAAPDGR